MDAAGGEEETWKMEAIPTLWNMADLGAKRLSRRRREFLMYLIGIMEMQVEGSEQVFCHVGEEAFHEEIRKQNLAKKMKEVKNEMICSLVNEESETKVRISKSMVKMVALLLLQLEYMNYQKTRRRRTLRVKSTMARTTVAMDGFSTS